jgi:site-specific recombinase XerD
MDDLAELLPDWHRHLRVRNLAPKSVTLYLHVGNALLDWLRETGRPTAVSEIDRTAIEHYLLALAGRPSRSRGGGTVTPATVSKHYKALQQLWRWLVDVEEIVTTSPFAKMTAPTVPDVPVPLLSDDDLRAVLATCSDRKDVAQLRDTAILRLLLDTGCRISEVAGLTLGDVDRETDQITVLGKGRRPRIIPFDPKTGEALARYLRARARDPWAARTDALWVGRSGPMSSAGLAKVVKRRGEQAGMDIHAHLFRHTAAHTWLAAGQSEQGLMRTMGWRSREMLGRYGASAQDERAREEKRRGGLGDRV